MDGQHKYPQAKSFMLVFVIITHWNDLVLNLRHLTECVELQQSKNKVVKILDLILMVSQVPQHWELYILWENRAVLLNSELWTSAKQWSSHGLITNAHTNFQMQGCPWNDTIEDTQYKFHKGVVNVALTKTMHRDGGAGVYHLCIFTCSIPLYFKGFWVSICHFL